tara:strand:+ start:4713 stop:5900 length:1188 start_codon:yes stop_codon:yes gene_type:complete
MGTPKILFNRGAGGLGRALTSNDHISALMFFNDNLPAGFATTDRMKAVYSLEQAEGLGIAEGSANHAFEWYQIQQFFNQNPNAKLWISIEVLTSMTTTFTEIETLQRHADGEIRQLGICDLSASSVVRIGTDNVPTTIQTVVLALKAADMPLNVLIGFDDSGLTDLTAYVDGSALDKENVSCVIGADSSNVGQALETSSTKSVPTIGAVLGVVSFSAVNESIGWIGKFDMAKDAELAIPKLTSGELVKNISVAAEKSLNDKGYIFLKTHRGTNGTFANFGRTFGDQSGDFSTVENNRTMDKSVRNIRTFMLPNLNSPLVLKSDGTLTDNTIAVFENSCQRALDGMVRDGEISAYSVKIDPTQPVLSTSNLVIAVGIVPVGVASTITTNIGFAVAV